MRDYYDIYILTTTQTFNVDIFLEALKNTVEKRHTIRQMSDIPGVIDVLSDNGDMIDLWRRYQKKYRYAANITWETAISAVRYLADIVK